MRVACSNAVVRQHRPPLASAGKLPTSQNRRVVATPSASRRQTISSLVLGTAITLGGATVFTPSAEALPYKGFDLAACGAYNNSSSGIGWCDVKIGTGSFQPLPGDVIIVRFTARAVSTGKIYDGSGKYSLTLSGGMEGGPQEIIPGWELGILGNGDDIPPIKEGGIRTLRIPPRLAYGEKGDGCPLGRDVACRIPPGSDVEITFSLLEAGFI